MAALSDTKGNAFTRKAGAPGGLTLERAVASGEAALRGLREQGCGRINVLVAELCAISPNGGPVLSGAVKLRLEADAAELTGLGSLFGFDALSRIAALLSNYLADQTMIADGTLHLFTDALKLAIAQPSNDFLDVIAGLKHLSGRTCFGR